MSDDRGSHRIWSSRPIHMPG